MADDIQYNKKTNRYNAAFALDEKGLPWHKLGQMVKGAMTWQEAMNKADLNWEVIKQPLYIKNPNYTKGINDRGFSVPNHYAIYRTDKDNNEGIIGIVGSKYTPIQNKYMFDFCDTLLENVDGAHYESAGILNTGSRIWVLARVPFDYGIGKDKHRTYLLFENSHDGSLSGTVRLTDVRVVCNNTLQFALRNGTSFSSVVKVKHTASAEKKLEQLKTFWTGIKQNVQTLKKKLERLAEKKVDKKIFKNTMTKLFGEDWSDSTRKQNVALEIARIFDNNDNNAFPEQKGTGYNLLNAITDHTDHYRSTRVSSSSRYTQEQARADSSLSGAGSTLKSKALEVILEECETPEKSSNPNPSIQIKDNKAVERILDQVNF